jgi:hypothetical protein
MLAVNVLFSIKGKKIAFADTQIHSYTWHEFNVLKFRISGLGKLTSSSLWAACPDELTSTGWPSTFKRKTLGKRAMNSSCLSRIKLL